MTAWKHVTQGTIHFLSLRRNVGVFISTLFTPRKMCSLLQHSRQGVNRQK